jgi:DNA ligase 1
MKYSELVGVYDDLSDTTKKLEKATILAKFLHKLKEHEEWVYLFRGRAFPDYDESEFGISSKLVIKAISKGGINEEELVKLLRKIGDLGEIAEKVFDKKKQKTLFVHDLSVQKVFDNLRKLVLIEGKGAVDKKIGLISELLTSASGREAKYIVRTLLNDLRVGVAEGIIRDAIAEAFLKKENSRVVEEAYDKSNDWAYVLKLAVKGKKYLEKIDIIPGRPLKVMLPVKVNDLSEAFRICGKPLAVEHKYDGFRVLINKDTKGDVSLFTRRLDNVTKQFPDVVKVIKKYVKGKSFILDSEVVGFNPKTRKYMPFEAISQRIRRKYDIDRLIHKLPVEINVFDMIYYNGKSIVNLPFKNRRKLLEKIVKPIKMVIKLSKQFISDDEKKIVKFYKDALRTGEEGIMLKKLDAPYRPGRRVGYIVKMKPTVNDLDLVITGAEYGKGKRAGGLTSFYLSVKEDGQFVEVGKASSGLKEKENMGGLTYKEMDTLLQPLIVEEKGTYVRLKPKVVVSVTYQNIQKSPRYSSGYAMRFPKITSYRPERGVHDIATLNEIKKEAKKESGWGWKKGLG